MRKPKTVAVSEGRVLGYGQNKSEARIDLKNAIARWCAADETHIEARFGWLLIAWPTPTGDTAYRIIGPDNLVDHGKTFHATCISNQPFASAIAEARMSIAQNAWDRHGNDEMHAQDAGLKAERADELRRWMKWQRSYEALIAAGKTPAEAHQQATGY